MYCTPFVKLGLSWKHGSKNRKGSRSSPLDIQLYYLKALSGDSVRTEQISTQIIAKPSIEQGPLPVEGVRITITLSLDIKYATVGVQVHFQFVTSELEKKHDLNYVLLIGLIIPGGIWCDDNNGGGSMPPEPSTGCIPLSNGACSQVNKAMFPRMESVVERTLKLYSG